jgi:hypothetical protein
MFQSEPVRINVLIGPKVADGADGANDTYLLIKHMGAKMDDRFVVTAGVEHEHMSASDFDETLGNA